MHWPYSYKTDTFKAGLLVSFFMHAAVFGFGLMQPQPALVSVMQAPSSIDIQMIVEIPEPQFVENISQQDATLSSLVKSLDEIVDVEVNRNKNADVKKELNPSYHDPYLKDRIFIEASSVQGAITEAQPLAEYNPPPVYPRIARRRGWEGIVTLRVLVESDGLPSTVQLSESSGYTILDNIAQKSVEEWKFRVARAGNMPLSSWISIPIRFRLND